MSGFQYKIYISETKEKGRGVFTAEFIPKGSLVWTLTNSNHKSFDYNELIEYIKDFDNDDKRFVLNHIYIWKSKAILCTDQAEFVNHSSSPNLCESISDDRMGCWASRDIQPGEELLDSYKTYETPDWYLCLCDKFNVESSADISAKYL